MFNELKEMLCNNTPSSVKSLAIAGGLVAIIATSGCTTLPNQNGQGNRLRYLNAVDATPLKEGDSNRYLPDRIISFPIVQINETIISIDRTGDTYSPKTLSQIGIGALSVLDIPCNLFVGVYNDVYEAVTGNTYGGKINSPLVKLFNRYSDNRDYENIICPDLE